MGSALRFFLLRDSVEPVLPLSENANLGVFFVLN